MSDRHIPKPTDEDRARAVATRSKKARAVNAKGITIHPRKHQEVRSTRDSVRSKCADCVGGGDDGAVTRLIRECTLCECHLWPWRNGALNLDEIANEDPNATKRAVKGWLMKDDPER